MRDVTCHSRETIGDRHGDPLGKNRCEHRQAVVDRLDRHAALGREAALPFDNGLADESRRHLAGMDLRPLRRVLLGDDQHCGLVEAHRGGLHASVADGIVDDLACSHDLTDVPRGDGPRSERGMHGGKRSCQRARIREGVLDRALRDVPCRGVLRNHRPVDRIAVAGALGDIGVVHADALDEERVRLGFESSDLAPCGDPLVEEPAALLEVEVEVEIGALSHALSLEDMFDSTQCQPGNMPSSSYPRPRSLSMSRRSRLVGRPAPRSRNPRAA